MRALLISVLVISVIIAASPTYAQLSTGGGAIGVADPNVDIIHMIEVGLVPTIAGLVVTAVGILGAFLLRKLDQLTGLKTEESFRSIEAAHRDALQSAIANAAGAALAKYGPSLNIDSSTPEGQFVLKLVTASVPEAVKFFDAADEWIINTANAKLALNKTT